MRALLSLVLLVTSGCGSDLLGRISGTATVRIRPLLDSGGVRGDLVLEDVGFASGDEQPIKLERLEWQNVVVGWFPG